MRPEPHHEGEVMRLKNGTFIVQFEDETLAQSMKDHHIENGVCHGFDTLEEALEFGMENDDDFDVIVSYQGLLLNLTPSEKENHTVLLQEYIENFPQTAELIDYSDVG